MLEQKKFVIWLKDNYPSVMNTLEDEVSQEADKLIREHNIENPEIFRNQYTIRQIARFVALSYRLFEQFDQHLISVMHQKTEEEVLDHENPR